MPTARSVVSGTAQSTTAANTALVHEFRCLYTHDLRRKQKRWKDGFLRFHTFNRRVIVYDQQHNYIGDTHGLDGSCGSSGSSSLCDGDELTLENGVITQVAEPIATTQTDLTDLLVKKKKPAGDARKPLVPADHATPLVPRGAKLPTPGVRTAGLTARVAPRHKPLSMLLGVPKGPHGRALLPTRSPFEEREANLQRPDALDTSERAVKRRRVAMYTENPAPRQHDRSWTARKPTKKRGVLDTGDSCAGKESDGTRDEPVDLLSEAEQFEPKSDVTVPNTPPGFVEPTLPPWATEVPAPRAPSSPLPPSSPPVSTTNNLVHVQEGAHRQESDVGRAREEQAREDDDLSKRSKKLRLTTGPRPKMLLCQDAPTRKSKHKAAPPPAKGQSPKESRQKAPRTDSARPLKQKQKGRGSRRSSAIRDMQDAVTPSPPPPILQEHEHRPEDPTHCKARSTTLKANVPPSPPVDTDLGPWSTEAMDLFDWRPPGYVFRGQGKGFGPAVET